MRCCITIQRPFYATAFFSVGLKKALSSLEYKQHSSAHYWNTRVYHLTSISAFLQHGLISAQHVVNSKAAAGIRLYSLNHFFFSSLLKAAIAVLGGGNKKKENANQGQLALCATYKRCIQKFIPPPFFFF